MAPSERQQGVQTICLVILTVFAVAAALFWLRPVLLPFVLALFFVSGISPVLEMIEQRLKAPRMLAVVVTLMLAFLCLTIVWWLIWSSVADLVQNASTYQQRFDELVERAADLLPTVEGEEPPKSPSQDGAAAPRLSPNDAAADEAVVKQQQLAGFVGEKVRGLIGGLSTALLDVLSSGTVVLIFVFFLLLGESAVSGHKTGLWEEIDTGIRRYLVTKTLISIVTGVAFGLVLWLFGVKLALVFGLLAFLLNFIPNIGPIVASLLPVPLIVLNPDMSIGMAVVVIALAGGIQFLSGNVFEPKIMGSSFDLHPIVILLTLMFWGMIWGIVGMFLATPITAAIKVCLERFEQTRPIAQVLAGRIEVLNDMGSREADGS